MKKIQEDSDFELQIIATGMHLSPEFGLTYRQIEKNGFKIDKKIEMLFSSDTPVGILWALIRPLLIMVVFTIVFGKLAKLPSEGVPYPILVFAAMLPWQFFANAFSESSNKSTSVFLY